jgi:hypothetical protein
MWACTPGAPGSPSPAASPTGSPASPSPAATSPSPGAGVTVNVTAADYSFAAPDTIQAGRVTMTLENTGRETHQAQLARIKPGRTLADVQAALTGRDPNAILALVDFAGGPDAVPAGQRLTVQMDLTAGDYVMMCPTSRRGWSGRSASPGLPRLQPRRRRARE